MRQTCGMLVRPLGSRAIVFSPPFVATDAEIEQLVAAIRLTVLATSASGVG